MRFVAIFVLCLSVLHGAAADWLVQPRRQVAGHTLAVLALAASPTRSVSVGERGIVRYAGTATQWHAAAAVPAGGDLNGVVWTGTEFIAVGDAGRVLASPDGSHWTVRAFPDATVDLVGVAYANGTLVIGDTAGYVTTTTDGTSWTRSLVRSGAVVNSIAATANGWVCASNGLTAADPTPAIHTSSDGRTWSAHPVPMDGTLYAVAFANGQYVAVGEDSLLWGVALSSRDGANWQKNYVGLVSGYFAVARFGARWFITGDGPAQVSDDGVTWSMTDVNANPRPMHVNAAVALGGAMITAGAYMYVSTDPAANRWASVADSPQFDTLRRVTWGAAGYVAVGDNGTVVWSPDGVEWTAVDAGTTAPFTDVTYGGGVYVAANGSYVCISRDGRNWRRQLIDEHNALASVRYLRGQFWAIGGNPEYSGIIWSSPDGSQWTNRTPAGAVKALYDIVDTGSKLFVGGYNGYGTWSTDGVTWSTPKSTTYNSLYRLAYVNGRIIACNQRKPADVTYSTDGQTWTDATAVPFALEKADPGDLTVDGDACVLSYGGHFAVSSDGANWRVLSVDTSVATASSYTHGNGTTVVVGSRPGQIAIGPGPEKPVITAEPIGASVAPGTTARLRFELADATGTTVQWFKDGVAVPGATAQELAVTPATPGDYGRYYAQVTKAGAVVTTTPTVIAPANTGNALANLSVRNVVNGGDLIAGFVVDGGAPTTMLVRAVGPGLRPYGVADAIDDPAFVLTDATGAVWLNRGPWSSAPAADTVSVAGARVGAFTLASADAAAVVTLPPGGFTVQAQSLSGRAGSTLVELYSLGIGPGQLINLSARGRVDASQGPLIVGFVVTGSAKQTLLVRGIGPALQSFGVADYAPDPQLKVFDVHGQAVAMNDDWNASLAVTASKVGAFALPAGSRDAALAVTLDPGAYTVHVFGSGVVLAEIYRVP